MDNNLWLLTNSATNVTADHDSRIHFGNNITHYHDTTTLSRILAPYVHLSRYPHEDKRKLEERMGGIIQEAYEWILKHKDFQRLQRDDNFRLLWIKGDAGKGKTMLLCGIVDELLKKGKDYSFFFCQSMDSKLNQAPAVLGGLASGLTQKHRALGRHFDRSHGHSVLQLPEGLNAFRELQSVLIDMLKDPLSKNCYLVVDALDDSVTYQRELIDFIVKCSSTLPAKWIVSSRSRYEQGVEHRLTPESSRMTLNLQEKEEDDYVKQAIGRFIQRKLLSLALFKDTNLRDRICNQIQQRAGGNFLWASLVVGEVAKAKSIGSLMLMLKKTPIGLTPFYKGIWDRLFSQADMTNFSHCREVLQMATVAYRPLALREIRAMLQPENVSGDDGVRVIIEKCGAFLSDREDHVCLVHQSAKDYLTCSLENLTGQSTAEFHHTLAIRAIDRMRNTLQRNISGLLDAKTPIQSIRNGSMGFEEDKLAPLEYWCLNWVYHLADGGSGHGELQDDGVVHRFLKSHFLYWMEALSLTRNLSNGIHILSKLLCLVQPQTNATQLKELVRDALRFITHHRATIENWPLEIYESALVFSPTQSVVRQLFKGQEPRWTTKPMVNEEWSACLQTLDGHRDFANFARFSPDDRLIASASNDKTIMLWDASTGQHQKTLEGHLGPVKSVAFSNDSKQLASASDNNVKIWETKTGQCLWTVEGHDSIRLSLSSTNTVKLMRNPVDFLRNIVLEDNDLAWSMSFLEDKLILATANIETAQTWDSATGRCLQTFKGHTNRIASLSLSPDGRRMASGSWDATIKVWSTATGECQLTLEGHNGLIISIAFSPGGRHLASASDDSVKLWDIDTGRLRWKKGIHDSIGRSLSFSSDGQHLALTSDNMIEVIDTVTGNAHTDLEGHGGYVSSAAFSLNSTRLVSTSHDKTVKIWDIATNEHRRTSTKRHLYSHRSFVTIIAFSPDGLKVASASHDKTIKIWDAVAGNPLRTLPKADAFVDLLQLSSDGSQLAIVTRDENIAVCTVATKEQRTLGGHEGHVYSVAFSHDSKRLASVSMDKTVKIWDVRTGKCLHTLKRCNASRIALMAFSRDKTRLAFASHDRTITFWEVATKQQRQTDELSSSSITSIGFSLDGYQLISTTEDKTIKVLDVATGQCQIEKSFSNGGQLDKVKWSPSKRQFTLTSEEGRCLHTLRDHSDFVRSVALSSDGRHLASASDDKTVKLWDVTSGKCSRTLKSHSSCVYSVVFSEDGRKLASASDDKTVKVWDFTSGNCLLTLRGHSSYVYSVAFSANGSTLASASADKTVKVWDVKKGECRHTLDGRSLRFISVAFSCDGDWLALGSEDKTIKLWKASTQSIFTTLHGHGDSVQSVCFSGDSKQLASASKDKTVKIWDVDSGQCMRTLKGHSELIWSVAFSKNGKYLASAANDKTVKVWDATTGDCLQTLKGHSDSVWSVSLSSDNILLASASKDKTINLWDPAINRHERSLKGHVDYAQTTVFSMMTQESSRWPSTKDYTVSGDGFWIRDDSRNIVPLAPEYRAGCHAAEGSKVALGCPSGRVLIMDLALRD